MPDRSVASAASPYIPWTEWPAPVAAARRSPPGTVRAPDERRCFIPMPLSAVPFACSLRVTDPAASLASLETGLAWLVATGRLHDASVRFDHVAVTLSATSRDDAVRAAADLLREIGVERVQVFAALAIHVLD